MSVTAPEGFEAGGVACGIKVSGDPDLALVCTTDRKPVSAAAVFTSNLAKAAPVRVSAKHLETTNGRIAAVICSSGNANAQTGEPGLRAAERMCEVVGFEIGTDPSAVLVCQTGLIGVPFPIDQAEAGIPKLVDALADTENAGRNAAVAMMTTDTVEKQVVVRGDGFAVGGMAKGAAMLEPNMATMLAVLTTDAKCDPDVLSRALKKAVSVSFNEMSVDGCCSTNDTVILLASGLAEEVPEDQLTRAVSQACAQLAKQMVDDAEGATKAAKIVVKGAASDSDAEKGARKVGNSLLVKCSLNGADPYWGRIVSELGSAGIEFDPDKVSVAYGGVVVSDGGVAVDHDHEAVDAHLARSHVEIECDLKIGSGIGSMLTCDLGHGYIEENRTTS